MFLSIITGTLAGSQLCSFSPAELHFLGEEEPTAVDGRHICFEPELAQEHRRDGCSGSQVSTGTRLPQVGKKNPRARALADCHQHGGRVPTVDVSQHLDVDVSQKLLQLRLYSHDHFNASTCSRSAGSPNSVSLAVVSRHPAVPRE